MKKNNLLIAIVGIIILVAILTNPNQDRHKEVIRNKLNSYLQKSMKESLTETDNKWEQTGQALGMMLGGAMVDRMIDNLISTDNYVLFSTTKISWGDETKVVGIGAFGNVFVTGKLNEAIKGGSSSSFPNAEKLNADYKLDAVKLYDEYNEDELQANDKYLGKIIEVTGVIREIKSDDEGKTVILETSDDLFGINCGLGYGYDEMLEKYKPGEQVKVKGECMGISMDVLIIRCVFVK